MTRTRREFIALLALLITLLPQTVLADGMVIPLEADTGYLVVRYHTVTVNIEDTHAATHVDQAFHNPHPFDVTARYLFPVPPDAMVTGFTATLDGVPQTVTRQGTATTNAMLYDLIATRHDPSLFQYADWETLVFEITVPAGDTRTMELSYDEVLAPTGGMAHYRYVLSTERYTSDLLEEASITVNLSSSRGLGTVYSSSHQVIIERPARERPGEHRATVTWSAEYIQPTEDFHLFFSPAEGGFGSGLLTGRQPGLDAASRDHFLFLFAPEAIVAESTALPKDIVFVIDRSGSMSGEKIVQARDALSFILDQLNTNDRFSIVGFDDRLDVFASKLQPVDAQSRREAQRFVADLTARDATDLDAALERGLRILRESPPRTGTTRLVIFLTDGLPTAGVTDPAAIAERARRNNSHVEARLHVFGVGYDVNSHLLDRLAAENGGSVTYVQPGENLELVLTDFYRRIAHPVLTDVRITFDGMQVSDLHPGTLPDMFEGSSLLLTGRFQPTSNNGTVTIRVSGRAGEERRTFSYTFDPDKAGDHAFVPQLWATRQIGQLLNIIRVEGETDALVDQVRDLGLTYGLVTPYTTFVIAAQSWGAASAENMALYNDQSALNRASGQTTIQARVQNQSYQQADQAAMASGANVTKSGYQNLAQVSRQHIDLRLLQDKEALEGPISEAWISDNIKIDRTVSFGSDTYFELAKDPVARDFLQGGNNVLFQLNGEVVQVVDEDAPEDPFELSQLPQSDPSGNAQQLLPNSWGPSPQIRGGAPDSSVQGFLVRITQIAEAIAREVEAVVRSLSR